MSDVRLVEASLEITFDKADVNPDEFEKEFIKISDADDDSIGQWLRVAKARGDVAESDPAMLYLMVELYRKMDRLEQLMTQSAPKQLNLTQHAAIGRIGLEHFELTVPLLQEGERYYGRIEVPVYPRREIPLYFEAVSATLAKIIRIHSRDENEWGAYMRTRERAMIRHLKGNA